MSDPQQAGPDQLADLYLGPQTSLQERAYHQIKKAILDGKLTPGQRLIESTLARSLGVSRIPLRSAIQRLQHEGLVSPAPGRGVMVPAPSIAELEHVYAVRGALEGLAARLAAERAKPQELDQLRADLDAMKQGIEESDIERLVNADTRFHEDIVAASGNPKLAEVISPLLAYIVRVRRMVMSVPNQQRLILGDHYRILSVVEERQPDKAEQFMRSHIVAATMRMHRLFDEHFTHAG